MSFNSTNNKLGFISFLLTTSKPVWVEPPDIPKLVARSLKYLIGRLFANELPTKTIGVESRS